MKRMAQEPSSTKEWTSSVLLRRGSSNKIPLKEKFVQIYEAFFQGEDPSTGNPNFWDELFLLKAFEFAMDQELVDYLKTILNENNCTELVKSSYIEAEFDKLNGDALVSLKENINLWFYKCVETLKQQASPIRIVNAIHTLCALIRGVFRKSLNNYGFDVINILIGFDMAEHLMQSLIESLNNFLTGEFSTSLKQLSLKLLLVLATATDNISQNTMLEYILINCVFESLVLILGNSIYRQTLGHDAVLLLTLLVQYRKYESANPYIVKLSILDDELALTGYAQVVSSSLTDFNREYQTKNAEPQSGWFSAIANMVGNMFVAEEKTVESVRANDSILLALYEAIHLNRNFITALTHTHTPSSPATPPVSPVSPASVPFEGQDPNLNSNPDEPTKQPTNLLVTFLEYSSIVMQDTKDETRHSNAKLCLIILTCIAEDQYANSLMTDSNMTFRVPLHRMPMRHRKVKVDKFPMCRPLVCALLDLMVEFILSHLMKNFPSELHLRCLGIIHRVLCYQKKCRVRLQYAWKDLWTALMNLLKFVLSHESHLLKKHNIFHIASKVVNIFNLFITYGDTFLPNPTSYDELYYEIIRMHQVFDNVYSMAMKVGEPALRYTTNEGEWKDSAAKLKNHLGNIRAIINHFTPKVDSWAAQNHLASLTEEQVLEVVRNNYDTLTLKLQDSLDQFERYSEKPRETSFFTQLVRSITCDVRKSVTNLPPIQQDDLLHEYPMIS